MIENDFSFSHNTIFVKAKLEDFNIEFPKTQILLIDYSIANVPLYAFNSPKLNFGGHLTFESTF